MFTPPPSHGLAWPSLRCARAVNESAIAGHPGGFHAPPLLVEGGEKASGGREHRDRNPAFALLEGHLDLLAAAHGVEVAIDDVGHHRHTLVQRHVRDAV